MDRRQFLQAGLLSLGMFIPGAQGFAFNNLAATNNKKLVVIFLRGAVDGLNVVIPYGDKQYYQMRSSIAIPTPQTSGGALDLDSYFGLNPALSALLPYWNDKKLAFIHASGSPDESRSHFDAQDYMESGVPGKKYITTGWINRLLSEIPSTKSPVRAINFGNTMPRILAGPQSVAMASNVLLRTGKPLRLPNEELITKLYTSRNDALGDAFREGMEARNRLVTDLAGNDDKMMKASNGAPTPNAIPNFGASMAKLLSKDTTVQVAFLALGGWDTHVNQGGSKGQLTNKLKALGDGLADFANGLGSDFKNTTVVVMSEFGRTAHENGNGGTDHGHGNVMWVLGGDVNGGKVYGKWSGLSQSDLHEGRDLPVTTDFRTVVSSVVAEQLELANPQMARVFPEFTNKDKLALLS